MANDINVYMKTSKLTLVISLAQKVNKYSTSTIINPSLTL